MAENHKIKNIVIRSIKINMMHLKPSLSFNACFTFVRKVCKCFFSIFNTRISAVLAFIATKSKFMTFPIVVKKFVSTCFASTLGKLSRFKNKITFLRTKFIFNVVRSHPEIVKTIIAISKAIMISKFIGTGDRTETPFRTICGKYL